MNQAEGDTILVPTDFTDVSEYAIDHAIEIAKIFKHKICLLHVISRRTTGSGKMMIMQENMENQVAAIAERTMLKVFYMIVEGSIFSTISEVADRINAEFIVIGIHGM